MLWIVIKINWSHINRIWETVIRIQKTGRFSFANDLFQILLSAKYMVIFWKKKFLVKFVHFNCQGLWVYSQCFHQIRATFAKNKSTSDIQQFQYLHVILFKFFFRFHLAGFIMASRYEDKRWNWMFHLKTWDILHSELPFNLIRLPCSSFLWSLILPFLKFHEINVLVKCFIKSGTDPRIRFKVIMHFISRLSVHLPSAA